MGSAHDDNEDRKQILGLVLERVIVVTSTSAELEVELVWVSGLRERLHRDYRAELDVRVRDLRIDGKAPGRIVSELRAAGVPSTTGKMASADIAQRSLERTG